MKPVTITLTMDLPEYILVTEGLGELQAKRVHALLNKLNRQTIPQLVEKPAESTDQKPLEPSA